MAVRGAPWLWQPRQRHPCCCCPRPPQAMYGYETIVMVGDGATDLEARRPGAADMFIGCGANRAVGMGLSVACVEMRLADSFKAGRGVLCSSLTAPPAAPLQDSQGTIA